MKKRLTIGGIILGMIVVSVLILSLSGKKQVYDRAKQEKEADAVGKTQLENTAGQRGKKQPEQNKTEKVSYQGFGNTQGNYDKHQTFLGDDVILVNTITNSTSKTLYFDTNTQELRIGCAKENCLHNDSGCASNHDLLYLQSYGNVYFGVPWNDNRREIWKVEQGEMSCFYQSDDEIGEMWCYNGYLYYMTDFGVYRFPMEGKKKAVQVLDRPILYAFLTFYEDSMYFCEEDWLLYRADLDGKNKQRLLKEKVAAPQIYDGKIYYRSAEYDPNGVFEMENTLYCITLDGKKREEVGVWAYGFCIADGGIYYTELPEKGKSPGDEKTTLWYLNLKDKKRHKITECESAYLSVFEQTDWLLLKEFEEPENEAETKYSEHLFCVKKDGTQYKSLENPMMLEVAQ